MNEKNLELKNLEPKQENKRLKWAMGAVAVIALILLVAFIVVITLPPPA